ncbi:S8/S53 family peptidase [Vineibacter terrae]|uniref:S8/S53 family peptidase n=1 Tax=Vineibacter terrae TaxID=2586908 RepID=UPI002E30AE1D|nr:S8/S53 family peptidase [Vineibacter terrae]HEX2885947.1 S8/S53 family peptidase [Vineibacter terrae]
MSKVSDQLGPSLDWGGVAIAHLDTGFTNHVVFNLSGSRPALLLRAGRNYMDVDEIVPRDPLNYGGGLGVYPGHGTRTAGLLCGNLPGTFVGLCPTVPVIPYRITNSVVLTGNTIINAATAIVDAVEKNLVDVISISLGVQSVFGNVKQMHALGRAVDLAYSRGVIIVAAAGQTRDAPELVGFEVYPARYSRTIGVGGINANMKICFDYEIGRNDVDVWAPADDIQRPNSVPGLSEPFIDVGGAADGTSYATVHVAAAAAMWLRLRGDELQSGGYVGWQRVEAFRQLLRTTAQKLKGNDVRSTGTMPTTGILDCVALIDEKLPPLSKLKQRPPAEPEVN